MRCLRFKNILREKMVFIDIFSLIEKYFLKLLCAMVHAFPFFSKAKIQQKRLICIRTKSQLNEYMDFFLELCNCWIHPNYIADIPKLLIQYHITMWTLYKCLSMLWILYKPMKPSETSLPLVLRLFAAVSFLFSTDVQFCWLERFSNLVCSCFCDNIIYMGFFTGRPKGYISFNEYNKNIQKPSSKFEYFIQGNQIWKLYVYIKYLFHVSISCKYVNII